MTIVKDSLDIPVLLSLANMSLLSSLCLAASSFAVYLASLVFYRLYLHPLAQHPGPLLAKITDWLVSHSSLLPRDPCTKRPSTTGITSTTPTKETAISLCIMPILNMAPLCDSLRISSPLIPLLP